jgi:hypothetical protein
MVRDLSILRTLTQALADLVEKRDEQHPHPSQEREQLDRMIRDLETEIAIRNEKSSLKAGGQDTQGSAPAVKDPG